MFEESDINDWRSRCVISLFPRPVITRLTASPPRPRAPSLRCWAKWNILQRPLRKRVWGHRRKRVIAYTLVHQPQEGSTATSRGFRILYCWLNCRSPVISADLHLERWPCAFPYLTLSQYPDGVHCFGYWWKMWVILPLWEVHLEDLNIFWNANICYRYKVLCIICLSGKQYYEATACQNHQEMKKEMLYHQFWSNPT